MRQAAIALLQANAFFADASRVLASAQVDADTVPCWSVSTPSEDATVQSARLHEARTNLVVAVSLSASATDIEALLDDTSGLIEALILGGLTEQAGPQNVQLKRTEIKTGPEDKAIIGTVMMLFEVIGYLEET